MNDIEPQGAGGKVLWHFTMSLDGYVELIDEIDLHVAPVLLGDGVRLYDNPGGPPVRLDPASVMNVRYRPVKTVRG